MVAHGGEGTLDIFEDTFIGVLNGALFSMHDGWGGLYFSDEGVGNSLMS